MRKGIYAAVMGLVATVLAGLVVLDLVVDWWYEGKPLALALAENLLPLALTAGLGYGAYRLYREYRDRFVWTVTMWTLGGLIGILVIAGWVSGLQYLQGEFKPVVIVTHTAVGGAVAGALIGYNTASIEETEAELEDAVADLERSNERLQEFAYIASHDLQEPLRMVSSYVQLLADEYEDELDAEGEEYVEFAVDGATRMQDMIDALLEYSRVSTEGAEFTTVDVADLFAEVEQDLGLLVSEHGAELTAEALPPVSADREQLRQVFQNLIENAIEHAVAADDETPPRVHVSVRETPDEVVFGVEDNGPGIPEDQQERIFRIFEQGGSGGGTTGIGLAICDRIVTRHGGELWVESEAGEGATFCFSIPKRD